MYDLQFIKINAKDLILNYLNNHPEIKSRVRLAVICGISKTTFNRVANGSNLPSPENCEKLSRVLNSASEPQERLFPSDLEFPTGLITDMRSKKVTENQGKIPQKPDSKVKSKWSNPQDRQEFFIPVFGFVWFYPEELKIIDHPAFQRLSGMNQLGMAYLVFRGATHRRFEHVLGTVGIVQKMIDAIDHNCKKDKSPDEKDKKKLGVPLTDLEKRLIRLAALLHDIGHLPYGHTFEDELRKLGKHDKEPRIDKIFDKKDWNGFKQSRSPALRNLIDEFYSENLKEMGINWKLSDLVKRIIIHSDQPVKGVVEKELADKGLRLEVCSDIVGNTICADILDYLHRDWYHVGKPKYFDQRILQYMEIRTPIDNDEVVTKKPIPTYNDEFVINIGNRPKLRTDGVSAILELLESRYHLGEAVLFHRTKMNATGMLERALNLAELRDPVELEEWLLSYPEEALLPSLINSENYKYSPFKKNKNNKNWERAREISSDLLNRNLFKRLITVTYEEFEHRDLKIIQNLYGDDPKAAIKREAALSLLEEDFGLPFGSIAMYCPESRMNMKIAEVKIFVEGTVESFKDHEDKHDSPLSAGHLKAQLERFKKLWKIGFFIDNHIWTKENINYKMILRDAVRLFILGIHPREVTRDDEARRLAREVIGNIELCNKLKNTAIDDDHCKKQYPTKIKTFRHYFNLEIQSYNKINVVDSTRESRIPIPLREKEPHLDVIAKKEEKEPNPLILDEVMNSINGYKNIVIPADWNRISSYCESEFIKLANSTPETVNRVRNQLNKIKLEVSGTQNFEKNQLRSETVINELRNLLIPDYNFKDNE